MFYCRREAYKDFTSLWSVSCFVLLLLPIITYKKINNRLIKMDIKKFRSKERRVIGIFRSP